MPLLNSCFIRFAIGTEKGFPCDRTGLATPICPELAKHAKIRSLKPAGINVSLFNKVTISPWAWRIPSFTEWRYPLFSAWRTRTACGYCAIKSSNIFWVSCFDASSTRISSTCKNQANLPTTADKGPHRKVHCKQSGQRNGSTRYFSPR